ncbi:MAG: hypothetical protein WCQ60_01415 [bacterium]
MAEIYLYVRLFLLSVFVVAFTYFGYVFFVVNPRNELAQQQFNAQANQDQIAKKQFDTQSALDTCISQAEADYDGTWNSLCQADGKQALCTEFVGSPKDVEYTKILQTDKQQCIDRYK